MVGEKMVTPSIEFDPAIYWCLDNSEEGIISPEAVVERIEKLVEDNEFSLMSEDMAYTSKTNKQPKWNRNVRNRLLRLKQDGLIAHIGPNQYTKPRDLADQLRIDHEKAWKKCAETALFYKENKTPLISTETFNIFVRSIGPDSIMLTKTSKNYDRLPAMEHYNGQVSTFSLNPPWIEKAIVSINTAGGKGHWKTINGNKKHIALSIVELHPRLILHDDNVFSKEKLNGVTLILDSFVPESVVDDRIQVEITDYKRVGQGKFRDELMELYENKCAITDEHTSSVLQAAHICPYIGSKSNHPQNGIILRSDIHLLFDNHQLTIDAEEYTVQISSDLWDTRYSALTGKRIHLSSDTRYRPSKKALKLHNIAFNQTRGE
jgi:hypothetical protein